MGVKRSIADILQALDRRAPHSAAENWDNVGLLVGDSKWRTSGAVVSIDLTAEAIALAKRKGYRLIINHHPCIFKGLQKVTPGSLVYDALRNGIAVYATHTNFDRCALEVPTAICRSLGLTPGGRLVDSPEESLFKLVVFVPVSHADRVAAALFDAGAGQVGRYDQCGFASRGQGTFRALEGTNPFLGKKGQLERADEVRIETVLPRGLKVSVLKALREAHPYEEIAYDLYAVEQGPSSVGWVKGLGYGFWADLRTPRKFTDVARAIQRVFETRGYVITPERPSPIRRIGFVAGKGASFVGAARAAGCDLFVTGEVGYHNALEGSRKGMAVMELGHRESERFFLTTVCGWLRELKIASSELNLKTQKMEA